MTIRKPFSCLMLAAATALPAQAAIVQFEAESGTLGSDFQTESLAGSSGGTVIYDTVSSNGGTASLASYEVTFTEAGTYDLYVRMVLTGSGSADSFFMPAALGTLGTGFSDYASYRQANGLTTGTTPGLALEVANATVVDGGIYDDYVVGDIIWVNMTANWAENIEGDGSDGSLNEEVPTYTVDTPGTLTVQFGGREANYRLDAFAFATTGLNVGVAADGSLIEVIPEPASLALLGLGGLMMVARRRSA